MNDYKGERVFDSKGIAGKRVVSHILTYDYLFQEYEDGSFFYAKVLEDCFHEDWGIPDELAIELGIASQETIERENRRKLDWREMAKSHRRAEYEKLKKEFEGQP